MPFLFDYKITMKIFIKIILTVVIFQGCTTSKTKIGKDFVCDGNEYYCERNEENLKCLATFKFSTSKNRFHINEKVYYEYSIGSDNNYSASFFCIENELNEIVYYRGATHYCSFYKDNEEGKEVKEYILSQILPIQIMEAEEIGGEMEGVDGEIEIKER